MIATAAEYFRCAEPGVEGYLKPRKKLLVDITASERGLEKCLRFADELFNRLEAFELRVVIAAAHERFIRPAIEVREKPGAEGVANLWSPLRATVVYFGTVPIGLAVIEMLENVGMVYVGEGKFVREEEFDPTMELPRGLTWRAVREVPSGRLKLIAYSPLYAFPWKLEWQETADKPLDHIIDDIAASLEAGAFELSGKLERDHDRF